MVRGDESLPRFAWRTSGVHQFIVGALAILVSLLNFAPIDLQRRIIDGPVMHREIGVLAFMCVIYLAVAIVQAILKYVLMVYQAWVSEGAIKIARDHLVKLAPSRAAQSDASSGEAVNVISREVDAVGGFVGTSISEFVVNLSFLFFTASYMLVMQPLIALTSALFLIPQALMAPWLQAYLNELYERQVKLIRKLGKETAAIVDADKMKARAPPAIGAIYWNRIRYHTLKYGLKALLNFASSMGPLSVLGIGGYMVIKGETTIGVVLAFVSGFERLSNPVRDLLGFYRDYQQARVQHLMIVRWLEGAGPESDQTGAPRQA